MLLVVYILSYYYYANIVLIDMLTSIVITRVFLNNTFSLAEIGKMSSKC